MRYGGFTLKAAACLVNVLPSLVNRTPSVAGDPVLFSVLLHRLNAIVREMTVAFEQAAMTPLVVLLSRLLVLYLRHAGTSDRHDEVRGAKTA